MLNYKMAFDIARQKKKELDSYYNSIMVMTCRAIFTIVSFAWLEIDDMVFGKKGSPTENIFWENFEDFLNFFLNMARRAEDLGSTLRVIPERVPFGPICCLRNGS